MNDEFALCYIPIFTYMLYSVSSHLVSRSKVWAETCSRRSLASAFGDIFGKT